MISSWVYRTRLNGGKQKLLLHERIQAKENCREGKLHLGNTKDFYLPIRHSVGKKNPMG